VLAAVQRAWERLWWRWRSPDGFVVGSPMKHRPSTKKEKNLEKHFADTIFDFTVGISFYAIFEEVWYQATIFSDATESDQCIVCTMNGLHCGPPSFPSGVHLNDEMRRRITAEVVRWTRPSWEKLLAVIAKEDARNEKAEFTQADEWEMEAAMHDTLMAEEDSKTSRDAKNE
jgi:hypothetical protein